MDPRRAGRILLILQVAGAMGACALWFGPASLNLALGLAIFLIFVGVIFLGGWEALRLAVTNQSERPAIGTAARAWLAVFTVYSGSLVLLALALGVVGAVYAIAS